MRCTLPKLSFTSFSAGTALSVTRVAAAVDLEHQRLAGAGADDPLHVGEAFDLAPIDRQHQIARLESGRRGGAFGLHRVDPRRCARLPEDHEQAGENHDRQHEIRHRPGDHDGRASVRPAGG